MMNKLFGSWLFLLCLFASFAHSAPSPFEAELNLDLEDIEVSKVILSEETAFNEVEAIADIDDFCQYLVAKLSCDDIRDLDDKVIRKSKAGVTNTPLLLKQLDASNSLVKPISPLTTSTSSGSLQNYTRARLSPIALSAIANRYHLDSRSGTPMIDFERTPMVTFESTPMVTSERTPMVAKTPSQDDHDDFSKSSKK